MRARLLSVFIAAATLALSFAAFGQEGSREGSLAQVQRQEIEQLIREYIRDNPEIILEAIQTLQAREEANQQRRQQEALASLRGDIEQAPGSPVIGNSAGDVTVVEFFDYRCSYCKSMLPAVQRLLKDDPKVRYVMKEFPILSPESRIAAQLALAVWRIEPKRYFDLHGKLMEARGELTERRIFEIARDAGVNVERARREMTDAGIERELTQNRELATALGITGTPGFVIGDQLIPGAISIEKLKQAIAEARRAG